MDEHKAMVPPELRDAAYTAIGLAILGMQRMQVFRRDVERLLRDAKVQSATKSARR